MKKMFLLLCVSVTLGACTSKQVKDATVLEPEIVLPIVIEEESVESEEEIEETEMEEDLTGKATSALTGICIDEEDAQRRPVAVVINNLKQALPQSGIGQASLYYEVLAEGDITRIVAIFQEFDSKKIGPIRSTRHYFSHFALDHDAIFTHHGGSDAGFKAIADYKINNLDGRHLDGTAVWRDPSRRYEHSAYSNAENLLNAAQERYGYRMETREFEPMFDFYEEFTEPTTDADAEANCVTVNFLARTHNVFEYDEQSQLYKKFQNGEEHIDEEMGKQLTVTNVLIQNAAHSAIPNDTEGRIDVKLVGSGTGYLATAGKYIPVNWSKASPNSPTIWTDENGEKLKLNKGKTWVNIVSTNIVPVFDA